MKNSNLPGHQYAHDNELMNINSWVEVLKEKWINDDLNDDIVEEIANSIHSSTVNIYMTQNNLYSPIIEENEHKIARKKPEYSEHDDLAELAFCELYVRVVYFQGKADDAFYKSNNHSCSHYLAVSRRYFDEMQIRSITTAI